MMDTGTALCAPLPSRTEVARAAREAVTRMTVFCRERFDLGAAWTVAVTLSFDDGRRSSRGGSKNGRPFMSLALFPLLQPIRDFPEYRSFDRDPAIGGVRTADWRVWLEALVAHEMAHCVQYALPKSVGRLKQPDGTFEGLGPFQTGHRPFFKAIYAVLRRRFVNGRVPAAAIGAARRLLARSAPPPAQAVIAAPAKPTKGQRRPGGAPQAPRLPDPLPERFRHPRHGLCRVVRIDGPDPDCPILFETLLGDVYKIAPARLAAFLARR